MSKVVLKLCKHPNAKPFLEEKLKKVPENYALMLTLALLRFDRYVVANTAFQKPFARVSVCIPRDDGVFWQVRLSNNEFSMSLNADDTPFTEKEARVIVTALNEEDDPDALASHLVDGLEKHNSALDLWSNECVKKQLSMFASACDEDDVEVYAAQLRDVAEMLQVAVSRPLTKQEYARTYAVARNFFDATQRVKMMDAFLPPWFGGNDRKGGDFMVRLANVMDLDPTSEKLLKLYKNNVFLLSHSKGVLTRLATFLEKWLEERRVVSKQVISSQKVVLSEPLSNQEVSEFPTPSACEGENAAQSEEKRQVSTRLVEAKLESLSLRFHPLPCQDLIGKLVNAALSCTDAAHVLFTGDIAMLEEEEVRQMQAFVYTDDSYWCSNFTSLAEARGVTARVARHRIFLHFDERVVGVVTMLPLHVYDTSVVVRKCAKHLTCQEAHVHVEAPVFLIVRCLGDMMCVANEASEFCKEKLVLVRLMYRTLRVFYTRNLKFSKNRLRINGSEREKVFFKDFDSVFSFGGASVKLSSLCDVPYNERMKKRVLLCDLANSSCENAFAHGPSWESLIFS